jgi:hypothetical protein
MRADGRDAVGEHMKANIARAVYTHDGFRERLGCFGQIILRFGQHRASGAIWCRLISKK